MTDNDHNAIYAQRVDASWDVFRSGLDAIGTLSLAERIEVLALAVALTDAQLDASQRHLVSGLQAAGVL